MKFAWRATRSKLISSRWLRSVALDTVRCQCTATLHGIHGSLAQPTCSSSRALRQQIVDAAYLIDSTGFRLSALSADWARFCAGVSGTKLHIVYNPDSACPFFAQSTPANVNDITVAKTMLILLGATYVFDLGYYDYGFWAKLDAAGCRIVTRLYVSYRAFGGGLVLPAGAFPCAL